MGMGREIHSTPQMAQAEILLNLKLKYLKILFYEQGLHYHIYKLHAFFSLLIFLQFFAYAFR